MDNGIKYSTTTPSNALRANNVAIGANQVQYGPTSTTDFWTAVNPGSNYCIYYFVGTSGAPRIYYVDSTQIVTLANQLGGSGITTFNGALNYFETQSNILVTNRIYENIVTSGLVFNIDSGFIKSYPQNGTSWWDISGGNISGTLTNSPTWNSGNGGYLSFDGASSYINFGSNNLGVDVANKTACAWIYPTSSPSGVAGIIDKDYDNTGSGGSSAYGGWGFWLNSSNKLQFWPHANKDLVDTGTALTLNTWNYVCVTWNTSTKTAIFYLNGSTTTTQSNSAIVEQSSTGVSLGIGLIRLGGPGGGTSNFFPGRIAICQVYNRILSSTEISQNFNAQRSRFGI